MHTLLLSCRKAAELIERRSFAPLTPVRAIQLYVHTRICRGCGIYQRQNGVLDAALEQRGTGNVPMISGPLEERIIDAVNTYRTGTN